MGFDLNALIALVRKSLLMSATALLALIGSGQLQAFLNWLISLLNANPVSGNEALFVGASLFAGLVKFIPGWIDSLASSKSTASGFSLEDDMTIF